MSKDERSLVHNILIYNSCNELTQNKDQIVELKTVQGIKNMWIVNVNNSN